MNQYLIKFYTDIICILLLLLILISIEAEYDTIF